MDGGRNIDIEESKEWRKISILGRHVVKSNCPNDTRCKKRPIIHAWMFLSFR